MNFLTKLGINLPIIQAPMAGVSTPDMAASVSREGALGSIAVGAIDANAARKMMAEVRQKTDRKFNVNVFTHAPARADKQRETEWLAALTPSFERYNAKPPSELKTIYKSFNEDDDMLATLIEAKPGVISFHFGLPDAKRVSALKESGMVLMISVTNLDEARAAEKAGIDAVIAQGFEAGGHRGMFDPNAQDAKLDTLSLTRMLVREVNIPVISAGGIMNGRGIKDALECGAVATQLGTAFIACPESDANEAYKQRLFSDAANRTVMTVAISGRPARCLSNRFTEMAETLSELTPPDYPIAYDAGKALHAAAMKSGEYGYGAQWAGTGAPLARALPASELVRTLAQEIF